MENVPENRLGELLYAVPPFKRKRLIGAAICRDYRMEVKVNAVVLRSVDYGENDKILTLLTAEEGKISAGVKGVRRAGAKLKFAAQPFCFAEYILARRGERNTVISASENESFYDLRTDINKFYAAGAACEAAEGLSLEGFECGELFSLTVRALAEICSGDEIFALIKFYLAALSGAGYGVTADICPLCGAKLAGAQRLRFDIPAGAFCCEECGVGLAASPSTYNTIRAAAGDRGFEANDDGKRRALRLLREYIKYKLAARCTSLTELVNLL